MAEADTSHLHPYAIDGYAPLVDAMRELRDRPHLDAPGRKALHAVLVHDSDIREARSQIDKHIKDSALAFHSLEHLKEVAAQFSHHGVKLEDIKSYDQWRDEALHLADSGQAMLADTQRYRIHLKLNPDLAQRIHANVRDLNAALGREEAALRHEQHHALSEDEKTAERRSRGYSRKL